VSDSGIPASDADGPRKVADKLFPDSGTACGGTGAVTGGDYSACPVTPALKSRLNKHPIPYAEQLCRCSSKYQSRVFVPTLTTDGAVVRVSLGLGAATQQLDVGMDKSTGSWQAADITCAFRGTSTSIFSDAPTLCYAPSGT
jgi:hypothetical protein